MTALNKPARMVSSARISEIANGANLIMGEKEWLANTAIYLANELKTATKAFQSTGFLLLDAEEKLEAAEKRIAELETRTITVKFEPIPMEELGNRRDGKKHPYMFGAGYNSAVVHCESVLHQACAAAGIGVKGE